MKKRKKTLIGGINLDNFTFPELDIYNLHKEWITQDKLVSHFGNQLALARLRWEQAKVASQVFEAETSRRVRQKPKAYGMTRMTEAAIKEVVGIEVLTSEAHEKLIRAKYKVDLLEVCMRRLEHRKKAITDCVFLHGQSYFAQPKLPRKLEKDRDRNLRGLKST